MGSLGMVPAVLGDGGRGGVEGGESPVGGSRSGRDDFQGSFPLDPPEVSLAGVYDPSVPADEDMSPSRRGLLSLGDEEAVFSSASALEAVSGSRLLVARQGGRGQ